MTPAIYARYSSDNQRETSIEDQLRAGAARCEREGWPAPRCYTDAATSAGTPTLLRDGGARLMADIRAGLIDILIIEALDRCWRDIVDQERTVREIERHGVRIIGMQDGYDGQREGREVHRGIMGVLNEEQLRIIGKKTHRGLAGQVARGLRAGGLPYGYLSAAADGGHRLAPHPEHAPVVLEIYQRFAAGESPRAIAHALNFRRVPSPRGSTWALSAITGHAGQQSGILRNPIYRGDYVWNKSRWVKNPDTGIRARLRGPRARGKGRPARSPWSGLLRCGHCGGPLIVADARCYGCGRHKDRGATVCPGLRIPRPLLESRLLDIAREHLTSPAAVATLRAEIARLTREHNATHGQRATHAHRRLADLEKQIPRLVDAIASAGWSPALIERLNQAETERAALIAEKTTAPDAPTAEIVPRLMERYQAALDRLPDMIARTPDTARDALRELLGEITVIKDQAGDVWAELPEYGGGMLLNVVAGARFVIKKRRRYRVA